MRWGVRIAALSLVLLLQTNGAVAYSVLTHEEIVDLVWTGGGDFVQEHLPWVR
jgi:hypothetical protein